MKNNFYNVEKIKDLKSSFNVIISERNYAKNYANKYSKSEEVEDVEK